MTYLECLKQPLHVQENMLSFMQTALVMRLLVAALAAINVSINRVNVVFEREASFRLNLIENNDLIVYVNSVTDPYSNSNASSILAANQE